MIYVALFMVDDFPLFFEDLCKIDTIRSTFVFPRALSKLIFLLSVI